MIDLSKKPKPKKDEGIEMTDVEIIALILTIIVWVGMIIGCMI